jgi:hypothetical protein
MTNSLIIFLLASAVSLFTNDSGVAYTHTAPWFLAAAVILGAIGAALGGEKGKPYGRRLAEQWMFVAACGTTQFILAVFLRFIVARIESCHLEGVVALLLNLIGGDASVMRSRLWVSNGEELIGFVTGTGQLEVMFSAYLAAGYLLLFWLFKGVSFRRVLWVLGTVAGYMILRMTVLTVIYLQFQKSMTYPSTLVVFYDGYWKIISFLPLALWAGWQLRTFAPLAETPPGAGVSWKLAAVTAVAAAILSGGLGYIGSMPKDGKEKAGRVAIDDYHSDFWEKVGLPFPIPKIDDNNLYSYSGLPAILKHRYQVTLLSDRDAIMKTLDTGHFDVLMIKTPVVMYSEEEIERIQQFVESGGGLLLVGDHSDLLGITANLNRLISKYGIEFDKDTCNRLSDGYFSVYQPRPFGESYLLHDIDRFEFLTSCTLKLPLWRYHLVIPGNDLSSNQADYGARNFFGFLWPDPIDKFGLLAQCASGEINRGRIALWTDGTVFSNFAVFRMGREQLYLNLIDYLNHANPSNLRGWLAGLAGGLAVAGIAAILLIYGRRYSMLQKGVFLLAGGTALLCGTGVSAPGGGVKPAAGKTRIQFVSYLSRSTYPAMIGVPGYSAQLAYNWLFLWELQNGYLPMEATRPEKLDDCGVYMVLNPVAGGSLAGLERITAAVANGSVLAVVAGTNYGSDFAGFQQQVAQRLKLPVEKQPLKIAGTEAERWNYGRGKLIFWQSPDGLSDIEMGNPMDAQRQGTNFVEMKAFWHECLGQ